MLKRFHWFTNLKFVKKIMAVCLIAGLLPLMALGIFCYTQIRSLLTARERQSLTETLTQAANSLEERLQSCQGAMMLVSWDQNLGMSLNRFYQNNYEMYVVYEDIIDPLFLSLRTVDPDIQYCTLYTSANLNPHGTTVRPWTEALELPWYSKMSAHSGPRFFADADAKSLFLVSPVLSAGINNKTKQNYLAMCLDYERIFSPLSTLYEEDFGILLLDDNGNTIYSDWKLTDQASLPHPAAPVNGDQRQVKTSTENGMICVSHPISDGTWELVLYRSLETVYHNTRPITAAVWMVILGCALLLSLLSVVFSRAVVRPLEELTKTMKEIEDGNLSVSLPSEPGRRDEIGILVAQFSAMVQKLQFLVNEVYKNKIEMQKYEMKALQAQINPHFFYNSLSLINSKAIIAGQEDISQMAQLLSSFYRTTLNRGKNMISVEDEWTNMHSYLQIQLMMHRNSFDVEETLDPGIAKLPMPNLLLQPLVENAIIHGIDSRQVPGRGHLAIAGWQEGNRMFFTISDNGCGMTKEQARQILVTETKGYGVQNVHRRICLYAGEGYGLSYESHPGIGTTARLTLPCAPSKPMEAD